MTSSTAPGRRQLLRLGAAVPAAGLVSACTGSDPTADPTADATSTATTTPPTASTSPTSTPTASPSESTSSPTSAPSSTPTSTTPATPTPVDPTIARTLATGLVVPWAIAFLPDGPAVGRALVTSRDTGRVHLVDASRRGAARVRTIAELDVLSRAAEAGEGGLLGLALHPAFPTRPWVYAYLSTSTDNRVVRMRWRGRADGTGAVSLGEPRVVLDGVATSVHHNGGALAFGPDGMLHVATGDAEQSSSAPDLASLNGKVLRLTPAGGVPRDNPWAGRGAARGGLVLSRGHRNVEGLAFDDAGRLWASEFGDQRADELNRIVAGADYGWPSVEGRAGGSATSATYRDPLATWLPDDCSPAGIAHTRGRAWLGALQGQCVWSVETAGPGRGRTRRWFAGRWGRVRAVAVAPDGALWVGSSNTDGRSTPGTGDDRLVRVTL